MRVIAQSRLRHYWTQKPYRTAEQALRAWHDEVQKSSWKNINEMRAHFPKASFVGNGRIVFNIQGDAFRLIVKIEFRLNAVYIRFLGTHAEYDTINACEV